MEENGLLAQFPCRLIVHRPFRVDPETLEIIIDGETSFAWMESKGASCLLAFTDDPAMEEYWSSQLLNNLDNAVVSIRTHEDLCSIVRMLKKRCGEEFDVLFDRSPTYPGWQVSYSEIVSLP